MFTILGCYDKFSIITLDLKLHLLKYECYGDADFRAYFYYKFQVNELFLDAHYA